MLGLQRVLLQSVALVLGPALPAGPALLAALRILLDGGADCVWSCATQEEQGGAGVYSADLRKAYRLKSDEWKYDILPEIIDGHNVADFVDADIEARLAALEREEDALAAAAALEARPSRFRIGADALAALDAAGAALGVRSARGRETMPVCMRLRARAHHAGSNEQVGVPGGCVRKHAASFTSQS